MVAVPELKKPRVMTPEEFLEWEYHQEGRYEYVEGEITCKNGEEPEHNIITGNIYIEIHKALENRPGKVYAISIRVRAASAKFRYPSVIALSGEPEFENTRPETLLNPQVLVEVLSDETRTIDLVDKLYEYLAMDSVTDYLIFEQNQMRALHHKPCGPQSYSTRIYTAPEDVIALEVIGMTLKLADIYRNVDRQARRTKTSEMESETDETAL